MCNLARHFAEADRMDLRNVGSQMGVDVCGIHYPNTRRTDENEVHVILICPTTPRLYLRLANNDLPNEIKIMTERNQYMEDHYKFSVQLVRSITKIGDFEREVAESINTMLRVREFFFKLEMKRSIENTQFFES